MTLGTTFGDKQQERIFQGVEENDGKKAMELMQLFQK